MEEYRLSDGNVYAAGEPVEVRMADGQWYRGMVVSVRQIRSDRVPVTVLSSQPGWQQYSSAQGMDQTFADVMNKLVYNILPGDIRHA